VEPGRRHRARACRGRATPRCGGCSAPQAHASHVVLLRLRVEPPRCGPRARSDADAGARRGQTVDQEVILWYYFSM